MLLLWKEEVQDSAGAVQVVTQLAQACGKARRNDLKGQLLGMFDEKGKCSTIKRLHCMISIYSCFGLNFSTKITVTMDSCGIDMG